MQWLYTHIDMKEHDVQYSFIGIFIIYYFMQAQSNLLQLPRRQYGLKVDFPKSSRKMLLTNFFEIKFGNKENTVYQFVIDTEPQIPADSKELLFQLNKCLRGQLKEKLGLVTASGKMLWGVKNLKVPLTLKAEFTYQEKLFKFEVIIKPTKSLDVYNLLNTHDGAKMVFQLFNNKIKSVLRDNKMDEVTRGKYFNKKEVQVKSIGLNILRGYKFTLCQLKSGLCLQIDVCSRVFRANNLLQEIIHRSKDEIDNLVGQTVITRYGKIRTYVILNIDRTKNPLSEFYQQKRQGKITFAQYYKQAYGLKIQEMKQPLIEVVLRTDKQIKNGQIVKTDVKGYLIPEFVSLTGMSAQQKANYQTMKQIAPYTKLTPIERLQNTMDLIDTVNGPEFKIANPIMVQGYQLDEPAVRLASNNIFTAQNGTLNFKDKVKLAVPFKDWVIVYSRGKYSQYDDGDADNLVQLIINASKAFGIQFSEPGFITCESNVNSWKHQIQKDVDKNGKPQIIVLFLNNNQEHFYGDLKRYITCQLKLPSQGIKRKTVGNKAKNPMSAASKIIIQMNQKIGGVTWEVNRSQQFSKRKTMYGAFSISKGKSGFTLAFVGTLNSENTKVFSICKIGYKRKEEIPKADFDAIFLNWAKNYVMQNKQGPSLIMIFREGLSLPQIQVQIKPEIDALTSVIKKIGEKTKKTNYNPEVVYLTVNKKINTRFFDRQSQSSRGSLGKFLPKIYNPTSGSCIFDEISVDKLFDFHLSAQKVTQGTCTPTQYIVVYNRSQVPQQSLAEFTYQQCFNYYNWQGAVKVPACLQCADKLAKLVGQSIKANVTEGDVTKSFYFL